MLTTQITMTAEELAAYHAKQQELAEQKSAERLAKANRARGLPEPTPGTKLYVSTARGISRRQRAGLAFAYTARTEVEVSDMDSREIARARDADGQVRGKRLVSRQQAEEILADDGLVVHTGGDADALNKATKALQDAQARIAELEAKASQNVVDARRNAEPSEDGSPSRLKAAAKARAENEAAGGATTDPNTGVQTGGVKDGKSGQAKDGGFGGKQG